MNGRDFFTTRIASGQIPQVFPNQWVRSCLAIDTVSDMIQWVVDGKLIENNTIPELTDAVPINLNGKIILGAVPMSKSWWVFSNKLTNLNIFSGLLPLVSMQKRTKDDQVCLEEGDYLAWNEMEWDLREELLLKR